MPNFTPPGQHKKANIVSADQIRINGKTPVKLLNKVKLRDLEYRQSPKFRDDIDFLKSLVPAAEEKAANPPAIEEFVEE